MVKLTITDNDIKESAILQKDPWKSQLKKTSAVWKNERKEKYRKRMKGAEK